jgi:single-strand DNA-binding protein
VRSGTRCTEMLSRRGPDLRHVAGPRSASKQEDLVHALTITAVGTVGNDPRYIHTQEGSDILSFRLAVNERRWDQKAGAFVTSPTSWVQVKAFKQLAVNGKDSLRKGERVTVTGRGEVRDWENEKGQSGTSIEVIADSLGHDLLWGSTAYTKRAGSDNGQRTAEAPAEVSSAAPERAPVLAGDWGAPAPDETPF